MELFKQIFHTGDRKNNKQIQNRLETILDDIQKIDQGCADIVKENKGKLGGFLNGFYEVQIRFPVDEEESQNFEHLQDLKGKMATVREMNYDGDSGNSQIALRIDNNITFDTRREYVSREMIERLGEAMKCTCNIQMNSLISDNNNIFCTPFELFVKFCSAHQIQYNQLKYHEYHDPLYCTLYILFCIYYTSLVPGGFR